VLAQDRRDRPEPIREHSDRDRSHAGKVVARPTSGVLGATFAKTTAPKAKKVKPKVKKVIAKAKPAKAVVKSAQFTG
jgi:ribosomal protein L17